MAYKWIKEGKVLQRLSDGAFIPWPPQESEGKKAKEWIEAGGIPQKEDPPIPSVPSKTLVDQILENPQELARLKAALAK